MIRRIIKIDEEKCNGCGVCAKACHEGAIEMINGKAKLTKENYCDGLGDCLPGCPVNAITFEEREAPAYDEAAANAEKLKISDAKEHLCAEKTTSQLMQWPCQLRLVPVTAPYFSGASLLIAADCTAYAYANFHAEFMQGRITLIGCPKLDAVDYSEKLTQIFRQNAIKDITVLRMEVPCCGGLEAAVRKAIRNSGKDIALEVVTLPIDVRI